MNYIVTLLIKTTRSNNKDISYLYNMISEWPSASHMRNLQYDNSLVQAFREFNGLSHQVIDWKNFCDMDHNTNFPISWKVPIMVQDFLSADPSQVIDIKVPVPLLHITHFVFNKRSNLSKDYIKSFLFSAPHLHPLHHPLFLPHICA